MIKFMLIALMACTGAATEEVVATEAPAVPATELTVTVEQASPEVTAASTSTLPVDTTAVEATTEATETTESTSAK